MLPIIPFIIVVVVEIFTTVWPNLDNNPGNQVEDSDFSSQQRNAEGSDSSSWQHPSESTLPHPQPRQRPECYTEYNGQCLDGYRQEAYNKGAEDKHLGRPRSDSYDMPRDCDRDCESLIHDSYINGYESTTKF